MKIKLFLTISVLFFVPFFSNATVEYHEVKTSTTESFERKKHRKIAKLKRKVKRHLKTQSELLLPLIVILIGIGLTFVIPAVAWIGILLTILGVVLFLARLVRYHPEFKLPVTLMIIGGILVGWSTILAAPILGLIIFFAGLGLGLAGMVVFIGRLFKYHLSE